MPVVEHELVVRARHRIGAVLCGKYRLDDILGTGGMAVVYTATHVRNANRVAVKVLHRDLSIDAGQRARFLREGYAANTVGHPGTVRVLDDDIAEDGSVFIVMELLDGETLDARWERSGGKLGVREVVTLMSELLDVLSAAHARGIVHRDLKPENLLLTRDGKLKVLDFGVARLREASLTQTKTGALLGTPAFMPPEQALGRTNEVDAQSDLWAVGATAFMLLAGRFVHQGCTQEEMLVLSATQPAPLLGSVVDDVPPILAEIVDRALAFDKAARWPTARTMREALLEADRSVRSADHPDSLEDTDDDRTHLALPPEMTLPGEVAPPDPSEAPVDTLELPTLPVASTVAGIESQSQPERARRGFPVVGAIVGGMGIGVAVAAIAVLFIGSKAPPWSALELSASSLGAPRPSASAVLRTPTTASVTTTAMPEAPLASVELPTVSVMDLPAAPPAPIPAPAVAWAPAKPAETSPTPSGSSSTPRRGVALALPTPTSHPESMHCSPPFDVDELGRKIFKPECVN
jgi:eukaryotic-like serine/threonine-protein kinase